MGLRIIGGDGSCASGGALESAHSDSLKGRWKANDSGLVLADDSGNGNNLAPVGGVTFEHDGADALEDKAVRTNTRNTDYFLSAGGFGPDGTKDFTINTLFKPRSTGVHSLFGWWTASNHNLYVYFSNNTRLYLIADHSSGVVVEFIDVSSVLSSYHMVTLTHDVSDKRLKVYLDKVVVLNEVYAGTLKDNTNSEFSIGSIKDSSRVGSNQDIDESKFWEGDEGLLESATISEIYDGYFAS